MNRNGNVCIFRNLDSTDSLFGNGLCVRTDNQSSVRIQAACCPNRIYKCLIKLIDDISFFWCAAAPFRCRANDTRFMHAFKYKVVVVVAEPFAELLPDGSEFFRNGSLFAVSWMQPQSIIMMDIQDNI